MKSLESRIKKLEGQFKVNQKEQTIIFLHLHHYSKSETNYQGKCPYEDGKHCPLYETKLQETKKNSHSDLMFLVFPCFKDGECPLCTDPSIIPTSQGDERNQDVKKNNPIRFNNDTFKENK